MAFGVLSGKSNGVECADAEGDEVVEDGAGCSGAASGMDDIMDGEVGFDGDFLEGGIDFEVAVEAEVADDGDLQRGVFGGDCLESMGIHCVGGYFWRAWNRLWRKAMLSL